MNDIWTNLGASALALLACLIPLWLISLKIRNASIIDIFWGFGFVVVSGVVLLSLFGETSLNGFDIPNYGWLLCSLPIIWGLRLTAYLARRNLGHGEDRRYVAMQNRAERKGMTEMAWRRRAFFTIFLGQGILILIVAAPIWIAAATSFQLTGSPFLEGCEFIDGECKSYSVELTNIGFLAISGTLLWLIGFLFEAIGDAQLTAFLKRNKDFDGPIENKPILDTGLWKYTRHPNYFGNACMWWGIWLVACQAPWGWTTVFAPIVMTILLVRVSGKDLLERYMKKRPAYVDYINRTSGFIPWFPKKR